VLRLLSSSQDSTDSQSMRHPNPWSKPSSD